MVGFAKQPYEIQIMETEVKNFGTIKKQLEERLRILGAKAVEIEEDLRTPRSASWEDRATEIEGDEVLDALEESVIVEINEIRAAMKRIDEGTYEACASCGEAIGKKRQEALPYATQCLRCAEAG
jgi:RNA polymerase-binding transcription factor DksA